MSRSDWGTVRSRLDWDTASSVSGVVGKGHAGIGTRRMVWLARVTQASGHVKWRSWQRARKIWDTASGVSEKINTTSNIVDKLHSLSFLRAVVVGGGGGGGAGG